MTTQKILLLNSWGKWWQGNCAFEHTSHVKVNVCKTEFTTKEKGMEEKEVQFDFFIKQ